MSASAPRNDSLGSRYGSLMQVLAPDLRGLAICGADFLRRSAWGDAPDALDARLDAAGWRGTVPDVSASLELDLAPGRRALLLPLVSDSGRLLGAVALVWEPASAPDSALLRVQVQPAFECLRQEISATDAAQRATELQLQQTAVQMQAENEDGATVEQLLEASLRRGRSEAAMLLVPRRGIYLTAQGPDSLSPQVAAEFATLRKRLRGLAGQLRRPLVLSGPSNRPDRSAACRLIVVPVRCCGGRVEALLAYLNPLEAAPYGAQAMLVLQAGSVAVVRRLEADMDRRTGLLNRSGLEAIRQRLKASTGSLLLIDIDRHHAINAVHGFDTGDDLILQIGDLLRRPLLPKGAYAARLFGGCFAVLAPDLDARRATEFAQQIQNAVGALKLRKAADPIKATVSCGIAEIHNLSTPLEKSLVSAEVVLKLAKERGRSRIEVHVSENSSIIRRHDEVFAAADLREALRTKQVVLYAQKIVSLRESGVAPGFELLIRVRDPATGEDRPPKEFMAAAQRYQLLPAVDRYVVDSALEALTPHRALLARQRVSMSINVSGQSVGDPKFVDYFIQRLRESKVPPSIIIVEVTEQAAVTNLDKASEMMRRLRDAGCGIALDDFGTGANSLAYLRSLPATRLKIDGSFIRDLMTNSRSEAAVRSVAQMAKNFRLETVAEFVESGPLAEKLRRLGIDHAQGYLFGKPEPLAAALEALGREESAEIADILQLR
jgi:diguanylate cyclase (GGDEF)-like protein